MPVDVQVLNAVLLRWIAPVGMSPALARDLAPASSAEPVDYDFESAIRRMGGHRGLWENAARRYLASPAAPERIISYCRAGQREAACREAHTLKGIAATLGLLALQRAAAAVEALPRELSNVDGELTALVEVDGAARRRIAQQMEPERNVS